MEVLDEWGGELELVVCNTICPAERVVEGREIAIRHMREVESACDDRIERMLATGLVPRGGQGGVPTHYLCVRKAFREQVAMETATLLSQHVGGKEWCASREMLLQDPPEEIKSVFCCVVGDTEGLLERLGLEPLAADA